MSETDREGGSQETGRDGQAEQRQTNIWERAWEEAHRGRRGQEGERSQEKAAARAPGPLALRVPCGHPACPCLSACSWAHPTVPSASSRQAGLGDTRQTPTKSL